MATDTANLKARIDLCVKKRAGLEERLLRCQHDLAEAEARLVELGLEPRTARAAIEQREAELSSEVAEMEKMLGLA